MALDISLHPLVIMNISDLSTRISYNQAPKNKIIGAVMGTHEGRKVALKNSFELDLNDRGNVDKD